MSGEALGRRLLRLDAVYCAGAGLVAVVAFGPLGAFLGVPGTLLLVAGVATVAWAAVLFRLAARSAWRTAVSVVAVANAVAALALAALALASPETAARLLLAAVAVEVAAFAVGQVVALRR